eukprot:COSAG02_NODE_48367_length_334_cov_0.834043_1_plen_57_part_10
MQGAANDRGVAAALERPPLPLEHAGHPGAAAGTCVYMQRNTMTRLRHIYIYIYIYTA